MIFAGVSMCGIVGYVGTENAVPYLINGLKKLGLRPDDDLRNYLLSIVPSQTNY